MRDRRERLRSLLHRSRGLARGPAVAMAGYRGSRLRQRDGDRGTQAAGRAGDESDFMIETKEVEDISMGIKHR